ncbi:mRNA binding protein puf3 [Yamadazyma tenuis]|uniref:Pumilio homology domain family member 3 n=1 Tax=Candida tenuis (strain ATCC 10573 / BCRC 21748 / CBS 615 / JCM 9827 / NBRC 10315 / NRRL Y-1498 / VKM Y-70) TaxID=590646 RepID=G3B2Q1_CANTC|nr:ARM repeat-containing protein [Yamadazyma tenuis ATCC 10573]EGV64729.1 ARM repeat-containing protein [Yamadazyma tenuis ATCC 10573]WEJ97522.1 mRNA binding protein puf3 [Yamadazyma tenuis]
MSDTIWSNSNKGSISSGGATTSHQYQSVLDKIEPEVAKMLSYNDPMGTVGSDLVSNHLSLNDGSDIDASSGNIFGLRTGALSAITAPVGGGYGQTSPSPNAQRLGLGTASISGGIANRHPPQDSFLQKFSGVADATKDLEFTNGFSRLEFERPHSRRTSFNHTQQPLDINYSSPTGSINESLNLPAKSRHQSISDKIDHYNNTSPIQAGASLTQELKDERIAPPPGNNIWNPAAATPFNPGGAPDMYQFQQYNRIQNPISPPPGFMMASPPIAFMDPRMYNMVYQMDSNTSNSFNSTNDSDEGADTSKANNHDQSTASKGRKDYDHTPGIGMPRHMPAGGFMFTPFTPYSVYQASPPGFQPSPPGFQPSPPLMPAHPEVAEESTSQKPEPAARNPTPPANGNRKRNAKVSNSKQSPHIYRSPLLEEVRSNAKGKEYFLKDIYGHAVEFTKDQHGSRFIQQKLPHSSEEEKEVIFNEIRVISYELMTDVFGNYVIQKYFEHGSMTQKKILLESMLGHIYELSLQMYGCRVVQRALEALELDGQIKIITELKNHILICAKDQNGNHVIQKSIERIPFENVRFILEALESQVYHLSTHPYGCRVIQRLLEHSDVADQDKILAELNRFIFYLIQDQYGNYVMQHILERGNMVDREAILKVVLGSVVNFSKHKFASNVIEKCIKFGTFEQRKKILHEVLLGNEDLSIEDVEDDSPLALMMKDQYANYVIQKLVEGFSSKSQEKRLLVLKLRQYLKQISSKNNYGKHLASVEKMIIVAETALVEAENV